MNLPGDMSRVLVIGTSCSGKTTLAAALSEILGGNHVELDRLWWLPEWRTREPEEFRELTRRATQAKCWVVDGNYSFVRDITLGGATAVIWLNYSFPRVFGRALRRTIRRVFTREELFAGNHEGFRQSFLSADSILWWVITTFRRRRREYGRMAREMSHPPIIELRRPRDAEVFLDALQERDWKPCEE
jgi:adenylate kinase family enzyme